MTSTEAADVVINVGDTVQLQTVGEEARQRYYVRAIGYLPGHSVLVTTPRVEGRVALIRAGQAFTVRLLSGRCVYGFNTTVLASNVQPFPYLHLSYPEQLQQIVVRKAQRVSMELAISVRNESETERNPKRPMEPAPGVLQDLSTTGALVRAEKPLGGLHDLVTVSLDVEVTGRAETLAIPAVLRNVRLRSFDDQGTEAYLHGLEFQFTERDDSMMLHAFVYEQIARARGG